MQFDLMRKNAQKSTELKYFSVVFFPGKHRLYGTRRQS